MSKEHRRSLVVFALVAVACAVIVATGLRSDALRGLLGQQARDVVAGSVLTRVAQSHPTTPPAESTGEVADVSPQAPAVAAGVHEVQPAPVLQVAHTGHAHGHVKTKGHGRGHAWGHLKTGHLKMPARAGKRCAQWARGQFPGHGRAVGHLKTPARAGKPFPAKSHAQCARGQVPGHGRALGHY